METPLKKVLLETLQQQEAEGSGVASVAKNPANCDAETSLAEIPPTPFLRTLGVGTGVHVMCIKRNHPTNAGRSPWAIKMLSGRSDPSSKHLYTARLLDEAQFLRRLSHPNIVGYRAFDKLEEGRNFIALEYCTTSLGNILEERYEKNMGPLNASKAMRMTVYVLRGLDYLHVEAHILHGDMKSFNILINKDFEQVKICDFGVSLELNKEGYLDLVRNPNARYVGTGIWSAPEVLENDPAQVSCKADIFSFGLVVYETLVLMPPHTFPGIKDESIVNSAGYASLRANVDTSSVNRRLDLSGIIEIPDDAEEDDDAEGEDDPEGVGEAAVKAEGVDEKYPPPVDAFAEGYPARDSPQGYFEACSPSNVLEPKRRYMDDATQYRKKLKRMREAAAAEAVVLPRSPIAFDVMSSDELLEELKGSDRAMEMDRPSPAKTDSHASAELAAPGAAGADPKVHAASDAQENDDNMDAEVISIHSSESSDRTEPFPDEGDYADEGDFADEGEIADEGEFADEGEEELMDEEEDMEHWDEDDDDEPYPVDGEDDVEEEEEEEEEEDDGPYLNYGVLGSRPPIPSSIEIDEGHYTLIEVFFLATMADPKERPSARQLLVALEKTSIYAQANITPELEAAARQPAPAPAKSEAEAKPATDSLGDDTKPVKESEAEQNPAPPTADTKATADNGGAADTTPPSE